MSQPFKLYRLQQIDTQLDQARSRLREIDAILSDNAQLRQAQERAQSAESHLNEASKLLHQTEGEVRAQNIKIEQSEASLYGGKIRNPKELQDLQKEIASLKKYITVLEDRQLESMIAVEEAEGNYRNISNELDLVRAQILAQHSTLTEERRALAVRISSLETEREAASRSIEQVDMLLYEQLRQSKRGVAVAKVIDNSCTACGSTLTPGQVQTAHSPVQLSRCSFCGRILYAG